MGFSRSVSPWGPSDGGAVPAQALPSHSVGFPARFGVEAEFVPAAVELDQIEVKTTYMDKVINMETFARILEREDEPNAIQFTSALKEIRLHLDQAWIEIRRLEQAFLTGNISELIYSAYNIQHHSREVGAEKVVTSCQQIEDYTNRMAPGGKVVSMEIATQRIAVLIPRIKHELYEAELYFKAWFQERNLEL